MIHTARMNLLLLDNDVLRPLLQQSVCKINTSFLFTQSVVQPGVYYSIMCTSKRMNEIMKNSHLNFELATTEDLEKFAQYIENNTLQNVDDECKLSLCGTFQNGLCQCFQLRANELFFLTGNRLTTLCLHNISPTIHTIHDLCAMLKQCSALSTLELCGWKPPSTITNISTEQHMTLYTDAVIHIVNTLGRQLTRFRLKEMYHDDVSLFLLTQRGSGNVNKHFIHRMLRALSQCKTLSDVVIDDNMTPFLSANSVCQLLNLASVSFLNLKFSNLSILPITLASASPWLKSFSISLSFPYADAEIHAFIKNIRFMKNLHSIELKSLTQNPFVTVDIDHCIWEGLVSIVFENLAISPATYTKIREKTESISSLQKVEMTKCLYDCPRFCRNVV